MAGNKINTKKKEDKNKTIRNSNQVNEESDDIDFSLLRKPIQTSITGFSQARKIFDVATEELKSLISNECDLLYECKVCRNIFRSLVNFISHKRIYCKEKFNSSVHGHFIKSSSLVSEVTKIKQLEESYQESLKEEKESDGVKSKEPNERIPLTKDLSEVIERIAKRKAVQDSVLENHQVTLQKIPKSSVAVYQNVNYDGRKFDSLRAQVRELNKISSMENAVLQSDGKFKIQSKIPTDNENVIQISDDDDDDEDSEDTNVHECKACDLQFTTLKTLKYHMKHKHLENRLVYPCPDCLVIFSTSWSVYRHLFKVHRKTAAQIRRLRESIQAKAFRMDNPPAFYEKRKANIKNVSSQKKTEEERLEQENQEWMDNMEGDGELPRCGGCGRTFARLAALAAHTNTCQPRSRALARRPPETKKIEIQIRKDYNKGPPTNMVFSKTETNETKDENKDASPTKSLLVKDAVVAPEENQLTEAVMTVVGDKQESADSEATASTENKDASYENKFINRLPFAYQAEKSNLHALKQKMHSDVEMEGFRCKKCDIKLNDTQNLIDHMATHYKWIRYGCKLCNYKHYEFEKLPEHIKTVHKLKGDTDFYFSTLKAIDGPEALEFSELTDDINDVNDSNPNSRRPSRCSSDSSRLSDDSASSVRIEGSRKRKINHCKTNTKKLKDSSALDKSDDVKEEVTKTNIVDNDSSSNSKTFEENSSDMDDNEEKVTKYPIIARSSSMASRRPVRKKTKPKNEDFEYDLSNLLKMEAQGYRDSQILSSKTSTNKKKIQQETQNTFDIVNKEFTGALVTLSRKSVENAKALMKNTSFMYNSSSNSKSSRLFNVFARPFTPRISKTEKVSPKKDLIELNNDHSPTKEVKEVEMPSPVEENVENNKKEASSSSSVIDSANEQPQIKPEDTSLKNIADQKDSPEDNKNISKSETDDTKDPKDKDVTEKLEKEKSNTTGNVSMPTVFPFKFGRNLDVMKNPLIKKNLTDFTKAGMKTKILVIKPINRNKDGTKTLSSPLKFQTIKLKDPNKDSKVNEEKKSDQVVVVPVPKVDCAVRPASSVSNIDKNLQCSLPTTSKSCDNIVETLKTDTTSNDNDTKKSVTLDTKSIENDHATEESGKDVLQPENVESY